jgi:hypothetical protein
LASSASGNAAYRSTGNYPATSTMTQQHNPPLPGEVLKDGVFAESQITIKQFAEEIGVTTDTCGTLHTHPEFLSKNSSYLSSSLRPIAVW